MTQPRFRWHSRWAHDKQVANWLRWFQTWWAKTERRCQNKYRPIRICLWGPQDCFENFSKKNDRNKSGWFLQNLVRSCTFAIFWLDDVQPMWTKLSRCVVFGTWGGKNILHYLKNIVSTVLDYMRRFLDLPLILHLPHCSDFQCILSWLSCMSASPEK